MMTLIDTSAWIAAFYREGFPQVKQAVTQALEKQEAVTAGIVVLELLRGIRSDEERRFLKNSLMSMVFLDIDRDIWEEAGNIGSMMASKGLHIPSTDLALAALAIKHHCGILHMDRHYELLAKHTSLRQAAFH